jgi:hypothetical protein
MKDGFTQKCSENLTLAGAESSCDSDFGPATHDGNRNRVVDEKCADNERNVAEQL